MESGEQRLLTFYNVGSLNFGPGAVLKCADDLQERGANRYFW
jgi:hypothetical protein